MRARAALALLVLLALTGCVQLPKPITGVEPPRPAMTPAEAQRLHVTLKATLKKADARRSQAIADDVLGGTDLASLVAEYDKHDRYGMKVDSATQGVKIVGVHSSAASSYPQQAVVVSTLKKEEDTAEQRLLEVWKRPSAVDPWLRHSSVSLAAKTLPMISSDDGLARFLDGRTIRGLPTTSMKPLADAFNHPKRQRWFKPDDFLAIWQDWSEDDKKRLDNSRITLDFAGGSGPTVIATENGGALIIGRVAITQTATVVEAGSYILWDKGVMKREFPGHYQRTIDSYLLTALIIVPPKGKPELHSFYYWWTGTTALT